MIIDVPNAPGLTWKRRKNGALNARWACRADLAERGFKPKSMSLCTRHGELAKGDVEYIQLMCARMQNEMLAILRRTFWILV